MSAGDLHEEKSKRYQLFGPVAWHGGVIHIAEASAFYDSFGSFPCLSL